MRSLPTRRFRSPIFRLAAVMLVVLGRSSLAYCDEIHKAVQRGDLEQVAALLKDNPDLVFSKTSTGQTPLHEAAATGNTDMAKLLLANKARVDTKDGAGWNPLHLAAVSGHKEVAELFLASGADVNAKGGKDGLEPLHLAAAKGYKEVTELLLANGADVNAKTNDGRTPMHLAARKGYKNVAELLRQHGGYDTNANTSQPATSSPPTPLVTACQRGDVEHLALLLSGGADAKGRDGATALLIAIREIGYKELDDPGPRLREISPDLRSRYVQIVKALLQAGADPNAMKVHGYYSAHGGTEQQGIGGIVTRTTSFAIAGSKGEIVAAAAGGLSALELAQQEGLTDIIPLLQQAGARQEAAGSRSPTTSAGAAPGTQGSPQTTSARPEALPVPNPSAGAVIIVNAAMLAVLNSMESDFVFFTSRAHPMSSMDDITDPDTQFGVAEFSPRTMRLRQLLSTRPVTAITEAPAIIVRPLGDTSMSGGGVSLMGIGEDGFGELFQRHPQLELFAARRAAGGVSLIESKGGGVRVRFVASGQAPAGDSSNKTDLGAASRSSTSTAGQSSAEETGTQTKDATLCLSVDPARIRLIVDPEIIIKGCTAATQSRQETTANRALFYNNRGMAYQRKGDFDQAIADYTQAITLKPDFSDGYANRGNAEIVKASRGDADGLYDRAMADENKALALKPDSALAYCFRAGAYQGKRRLDQAIVDDNKAILLKPDFAEAYNNRCSDNLQKNRVDQAIADCDHAIALDSALTEAYVNRGTAQKAKGRLEQAIADYSQAIAIDPDHAVAYFGRAAAYEDASRRGIIVGRTYDNGGIGMRGQAIADYRMALKLGFQMARHELRRLGVNP